MSLTVGRAEPVGTLALRVLKRPPARELGWRDIAAWGLPRPGLPTGVAMWRLRNLPNLWRGVWRVFAARALGVPHAYGVLFLEKLCGDGTRVQYGLASMRVVTDDGVGYIVDAFQNLVELEDMKYHGFGTGTTAEDATDSALVTELTTEYETDDTRPTGTTAEGATGNIYKTVATLTPDSGGTLAVTEHGVFSASSSGVLLDRTKFAAVNLDSTAGDSLQATYQLTIASGS